MTPNNLPNMGQEYSSIEYLVNVTNVPFEDFEILGLKVMKQLINWEWGMKTIYNHSVSVAYLLNRQHKFKEIVETKYRLIEKTVKSNLFLKSNNVIDPVIGEQLEVYYS